MMVSFRLFGLFVVSLLVCSLFVPISSMSVVGGDEGVSVRNKLVDIVTDVIGFDLSKYSIENEISNTWYDRGMNVEGYHLVLVDEQGGSVSVIGDFKNGFPTWVRIGPRNVNGTLYYTVEPPGGSVGKMKNIFERYVVFAQKYELATVDTSSALKLFNKAPWFLPKDEPAVVSLDDLTLNIAQNEFYFVYTVDGVTVPNKGLLVRFDDDRGSVTFSDSFGLYGVCEVNVFSKGSFESFAFEKARAYGEVMFAEFEVKPDWSNMRSDISLYLISGQSYNNELNNAFLEAGVGNTYSAGRSATTLYPFWQGKFYFSQPVGNIMGVQVGVWGDTGEVSYCYEMGYLGSQIDYSTEEPPGQPDSSYDLSTFAVIALIALFFVVVAAVMVFLKKKRR